MRRFARHSAGLILAATLASGLTRPGGRDGRAARHRDRLRPARRGRGHARGPRQAAGYRRPRGGQAGLRPRDDRDPRPARGDRQGPRHRHRQPGRRDEVEGREVGAGRGLPRLDRPARVLGRAAVHPRRLPPAAAGGAGRHDRRRGSRRSPTSRPRPTPRRTACDRWPPTPSRPRRRSPRSSAARSCRPRTARRSPSWPPSSPRSTSGSRPASSRKRRSPAETASRRCRS